MENLTLYHGFVLLDYKTRNTYFKRYYSFVMGEIIGFGLVLSASISLDHQGVWLVRYVRLDFEPLSISIASGFGICFPLFLISFGFVFKLISFVSLF